MTADAAPSLLPAPPTSSRFLLPPSHAAADAVAAAAGPVAAIRRDRTPAFPFLPSYPAFSSSSSSTFLFVSLSLLNWNFT